ncbi:hypothetical protein [Staphylococcus gallinarum]|uniref:hypothetical protein n=1 Tax=Staphylococcus gallinarum TaxID=1293 RepID=UPI001E37BB7E|nr:hypothetical protein [Staphylococcus gallinarum]MCD8844019.1 hypothetical protein [Staphylococcus gallinarum]
MSKSEEVIQNEIYSDNVVILDKYECLSIGSTTVNSLIKSRVIKEYSVSNEMGKKNQMF